MALKIASLLPQPGSFELAGEKILLYPLTLSEIAGLLMKHRETLVAMYAIAGKQEADYTQFLLAAPDLVAEVIGISARLQGQEEDIKQIPASLQLIATTTIWGLSVPDVKELALSLSKVTAGLQRLSTEQENEEARVLLNSSTPNSATSPGT